MLISALHTLQTSSPHGIEASWCSLWDGLPLLLKSNSQFFQVPWGIVSLLDLITEQCPHVFNWVDVRGLCRPVHHINPSISEERCANSGSVWSSVVMLKHLYLWMVLHEWLHLLLQDFVPVPHSIEVPLDHKISTVPSRNPTPHHMRCTPSISVCFTDA